MRCRPCLPLSAMALLLLAYAPLPAPAQVPTPREHFGFEPGDDRRLANWTELLAYYDKLARTSPRVKLDTLGRATRGQPFVMLTVTSPENHARLEELRAISQRLADPRRTGAAEARDLIERGRTIVLITHQIHSTEVGGGQMAANLLYRLAASEDQKVREILDNVVLLDIPSLNPDGTQWVSDWYRRWVGTEFEAAPIPWLYQFYIGHDNNRDWYAFTQVETQLTVSRAHNVWRPQIVHDVHQMGATGARIFVPPFVDPMEPNIDPVIIMGGNQLGAYMGAELTAAGKTGVVMNAQYDLFTPARAYQHYHAGVRILTETASARMATPIEIPPERRSSGRGFTVDQQTWNFPAPWPGGTWRLKDIVSYQETAAMALLTNAARNRRYWLESFYGVGQRAVERWPGWPHAWVIPAGQSNTQGVNAALRILRFADVEVHTAQQAFTAQGRQFPAGSFVIPMNQPYASWAQTMLEVQRYPDLRDYPGGPPTRPYDVTAHTLPLLMALEAVPVTQPLTVALSREPIPVPPLRYEVAGFTGRGAPRVAIYKGWRETMPAGWTRWVFDQHGLPHDTLHDARVRAGNLRRDYDVIVFQDQEPDAIVQGWGAEMPPEYRGGIGQPGVDALKRFVEEGGRLIAIEEATDFAINAFGLQIVNAVTGVRPQDFYIPGSILRLDADASHHIAAGIRGPSSGALTPACGTCVRSIAWYWPSSRAFDVRQPGARVVARYGEGDARLSGWVLGVERVAGKAALVEVPVGRGSVVLFGFQPNYRGQTMATWPLLFNAMKGPGAATTSNGSR
ncbi:MAG TPA: M14 metallopeptidase family protein [Gemmatimonadales bacterium]|nr:M14 metallopeptidase family protein [Gemmatimonadales bacterium]